MGPIATLNAILATMKLPEGIVWMDAGDGRVLHHLPPSTELHAWLIRLPTVLSGKIACSKRLTFSIAEASPEHLRAVEERVQAAIGEFQQALRDGAEILVDDCGELP